MTLADLANIGELFGGVAVVASLVYLAIQVRQSNRTIRTSTLQANTALWTSFFSALADPKIAEAYTVGMVGKEDIDPIHFAQFFLLCRGMFVAFENQFFQYCEGTIDDETYKGYERSISSQMLVFPGFRIWWEQNREVFSPTFALHVDQMISDVPEASPDLLRRQWQSIARARSS